MADLTAWVVDDDPSIRWVIERAFTAAAIDVVCFPGGAELLDAIGREAPDVLLTDIRMPGISGLALLERVHAVHPQLPVIIITAHSDLDSAVSSYRGGAFEYLPKPFDLDEAVELVRRAAAPVKGARADEARTTAAPSDAGIIGEAPAMQALFRAIGRLASSNITALITGESGTGKERVAHALHEHSPRAQRPFIAVNTAAIPPALMESEFFGHEKGAFTGASAQRRGRFEQAHGGTLFLDEIGDMPAELQTRLLRVLQDGRFHRVGGHAPIAVDVRIIAATNQDLEARVARGGFREDLFHRLNVIRLRVPPLRERREDIPALLAHFLERAACELGAEYKALSAEAGRCLAGLNWPGNVRELENLCRWLVVMAPGQTIRLDDLPPELRDPVQSAAADPESEAAAKPGAASNPDRRVESVAVQDPDGWDARLTAWAEQRLAAGDEPLLDQAVPRLERALIRVALAHTGGHRREAARLLGWGRNTLTRKIRELGLADENG